MATLIPTSSTNVEAYEDMFKEITRKLYGEETGHGLHTLGTPVAHVATGGPTAPEGERSFTTLISDRSLATIDYDHVGGTESNNLFKSDDHLTTAFGLAALMQNGFPPPGSILNPHNFVAQQQQKQQQQQQQQQQQSSSGSSAAVIASTSLAPPSGDNSAALDVKWPIPTEDCLPWSNNKNSSFNVPQKLFKVKKQEHDPANPTKTSNAQTNSGGPKRYNCSSCPYSTDRRDLFTRHENIHKEEKPFHCYVCLKQFNRADHVKKHFLRMHRGLAYEISRTKRITATSGTSSGGGRKSQYFPQTGTGSATGTTSDPQNHQQQQPTTLTIPTNTYQQQPNNTNTHPQDPTNQMNANQNATGGGNGQLMPVLKQEKVEKTPKRKGEKRFTCCYCPWSGTDNWGLKRHLNTHTKPYVCMLCDYKAARSERLATHVFKVHNKKVCGKCNFLADNQEDYQTHINEAHAHDTRPQRNSNNSTETAANVLRTIGNSFNIPNSQLNTIHNVATGHVFGMSDNLVVGQTNNSNNIGNNWRSSGSGGGSTAIMSSSSGVESTSSIQKRGAERLFQYMEADGSDPEDYTRQLQMAALSRNTASVAQDFHNAGGGVKTFVSNHSAEDNYKKIIMKHIKTEASKDVPWRQEYEQQQQLQHQQLLQFAPSAATFKNVSPPAPNLSHQHQPITTTMTPTNYNNNTNRKRRKVSHEKENENIFFEEKPQQSPTTSPTSSTQAPLPVLASQLLNTNLKTHFDNYIRAQFYNPKKHLNLQAIIGDAVDAKDNNNRQSFKLPNHPELELSVTNVKVEQNVATDLRVGISGDGRGITIASEHNERVSAAEKRGRKQAQPRKVIDESEDIPLKELLPIAAIPTVTLAATNDSRENQIRDKHLDRLVSKKLRCTICRNRNQCMIMPYHTKASLMLHKLWRHTARNLRCKLCPYRCCKSYKMELHRRQRHGSLRR